MMREIDSAVAFSRRLLRLLSLLPAADSNHSFHRTHGRVDRASDCTAGRLRCRHNR